LELLDIVRLAIESQGSAIKDDRDEGDEHPTDNSRVPVRTRVATLVFMILYGRDLSTGGILSMSGGFHELADRSAHSGWCQQMSISLPCHPIKRFCKTNLDFECSPSVGVSLDSVYSLASGTS